LDDIRSLRRPSEKLDFWRKSRLSDEVILENQREFSVLVLLKYCV
jgi:hypothetical protein